MKNNVKEIKKKSRYITVFIIIFSVVALAGVGISCKNLVKKNSPSRFVHSGASAYSMNRKEKTKEEKWSLTLVNKNNPIKEDGDIQITTLFNGEKVDTRIYPYLQKMFDSARKDGVYPIVASGYRTANDQKAIYDQKIKKYEENGLSYAAAKKETEHWVAVPGTSEHQLGLGVDINADGVNSKGTQVYDWLEENAHLYGFIKRYPANKTEITGVANEPWHYRYVGKKAAAEIYNAGICLEEYLGQS